MSLDAASALALVDACLAAAESLHPAISVAVVDPQGAPIAGRRSERSTSMELAIAKAYSAAVLRRPTRDLEALRQVRPVLFVQLSDLGPSPVICGSGGLLVVRAGALLGGLGVSGAPGDLDDRIAGRALDALGLAGSPAD